MEKKKITSLRFLNEFDQSSLLAVGYEDGVVRIWKDVFHSKDMSLLTAWRALIPGEDNYLNLEKHKRYVGLVLNWNEKDQQVFASGPVSVIKLYDIEKEICLQSFETEVESPLLSMRTPLNNLLLAGFMDGTIAIYDTRLGKYAKGENIVENKSLLINLFSLEMESNSLISGYVNGDIMFWDMRQLKSPTHSFNIHSNGHVNSFDIQESGKIIAGGFQDQRVKIMNFSGEQISMIKYHDGFLGQRIAPVSCLNFHKHKLSLAVGTTDSVVTLYSGNIKREKWLD